MNIIEHPFKPVTVTNSSQHLLSALSFNPSPDKSSPRLTVEREVAVDLAEARSGEFWPVLPNLPGSFGEKHGINMLVIVPTGPNIWSYSRNFLGMTNSLPWYRWSIEIDGLPMKNGDFPWHGYVK